MSSFIHLEHACIPIVPILDPKISLPLVPTWGDFSDKKKHRKTQDHKIYGQTIHETDIRLDRKVTVFPVLSFKLFSLLVTPYCHPLLLPVFRGSRKLFASSSLCVGSSYCFDVVRSDVCLKQNSDTLLVQACATDMQKTIDTGLKRKIFFPFR